MTWPTLAPGAIPPFGACGHYPEEMPGVQQIVFTRKGDREWNAEVFDDLAPSSMPVGVGNGVNLAHSLAVAIVDHNQKRGA